MQSSQHRSRHHCKLPVQAQVALLGGRRRHGRRIGNTRTQGGVCARAVVMRYPFFQDRSQVRLRDRNQPVKTLTPNCPDHSLADRIGHRAARRGLQHREPKSGDGLVQALREDAIAVVEWVSDFVFLSDCFTQLLQGPGGTRVRSHVYVQQPARAVLDHHEDV